MSYPTIKYAVQTDIGRVRQNNEDNFIEYISPDRHWMVLGAIDGVGGYEGGEVAAQICKNVIEERVRQLGYNILSNPLAALKQALTDANNKILDESLRNPKLRNMSCVASMAFLDVRSELLFFAHVGDTRGYIFRKGELIKFTHDHSVVGQLEDAGTILEQDALNHPRRNEILKMLGAVRLGTDDNEYIEVGTHSFYAKDIVLFCSDGLTDLVNRASIIETLGKNASLNEKVQELIAKANNLSGKDNITVGLASYNPVSKLSKEELEENVIIASSKNNRKIEMKPNKKNLLFYLLAFLLGAATMFLLDRFVFQKDNNVPTFDNTINMEELRTNPLVTDSLANDSTTANDSIAHDTITLFNYER